VSPIRAADPIPRSRRKDAPQRLADAICRAQRAAVVAVRDPMGPIGQVDPVTAPVAFDGGPERHVERSNLGEARVVGP
jgi:hypothetical protein